MPRRDGAHEGRDGGAAGGGAQLASCGPVRFAICAVPGVVAAAALPLASHLVLQRGRDHCEHRLEEVPLMEQCPSLEIAFSDYGLWTMDYGLILWAAAN